MGRRSDLFSSHLSYSQIGGTSSFMLSPQSEAPDVRNWFSSYEYETPSQDETSFLDIESCAHEEGYGDDGVKASFEEIAVENRRNDHLLVVKEKGFVGAAHNHGNFSPKNNSNEFDQRKSSKQCNFLLIQDDHVLQQKIEGRHALNDYNKESSKVNDSNRTMTTSKNVKGCLEIRLCNCIPDEGLSLKCDHVSELAAANISGWLEQNSTDSNGRWISTKNFRNFSGNDKGSRKETSRTKRQEIVKLDLKKSGSLRKRDALTGHTNVVPSKWRCPSKNKPNLGPPMKQLRLECWVKRVT